MEDPEHDGWRMELFEDGGWRMEGRSMVCGGLWLEDGGPEGWSLEDGRWRMEGLKHGLWEMVAGGWSLEDGRWRMVSGG
jgi:hypothetical protein